MKQSTALTSRKLLSAALVLMSVVIFAIMLVVSPAAGESQEAAVDADMKTMLTSVGDFTPANAAPEDKDGKSSLNAAGDSVKITKNVNTGYASFVLAVPGSVRLPVGDDASAVERADAFLQEYGSVFGISDAKSELAVSRVSSSLGGDEHVLYEQFYNDIPVFAGQLKVHFNGQGEFYAANGTLVPDVDVRTPTTLSAEDAEAIAINEVVGASAARNASTDLSSANTRLVVFRTGLVQRISGETHLAYEVEVTNPSVTVREFVYVDAHNGAVLDQFTGIYGDLDREVSETTLANVVWDESAGHPDPIPAGWASGTAQQVLDWQNEIDGARETYNLFASMGGWDSYDNNGATMRTVNNDPGISCPNAMWNGISTNYCTDVTGDDTVAHEWGHAYMDFTANLIYAWQPGALNESYSDVWGEVVDLLNERMLDTPDVVRTAGYCSSNDEGANFPNWSTVDTVRWLSGESDPAFDGIPSGSGNAIRDMWEPNCFGDPGAVSDTEYWCSSVDGGGVHTNSGVPNRAFALMVDGEASLGIAALGLTKSAHIHWKAQNLLTNASDFADHASALEGACLSLIDVNLPTLSTSISTTVPSGVSITESDCIEVGKIVDEVEFLTPPDQCGFEPAWTEAPALCEGQGNGEKVRILFQDWEDGQGSWITGTHDIANPDSFDNPDWVVRGSLPDSRPNDAMYVEDSINRGACTPEDTVAGALNLDSPPIEIPANADVPRVAIDHYVATESGWDGGNLKVSVNDGPWQVVPDSAIDINGYFPPGAINGGSNDNPLGGEPGWTGGGEGSVATGWGQTQVDLSGFAAPGDTVILRFDMGLDGCNGVDGWYVDEVEVYYCMEEQAGVCGDSILDPRETCDDGNTDDGDGCSSTCQVENGWICTDPIPPTEGSNVVDDGSFEAGTPNPYWDEYSTNGPSPIYEYPPLATDGTWIAWFGGWSDPELGILTQTVTIPDTAGNLEFNWLIGVCDDVSDYLSVSMDSSELFDTGDCAATSNYATASIDISAYADNGDHELVFKSETYSLNEGWSNFFVDEVVIDDNLATDPVPSVCRQLTYDLVCNGEAVDFEGGIPPTWSTSSINNVYWTTTDDADGCGRGNLTPGSGEAACADSDYTNGSEDPYDAIMETNPFDLSGYVSKTLTFAAAFNSYTGNETFEVDVWDGITWTNELTWDTDHYNPGEIVTIDLSEYDGYALVRYRYSGEEWDFYAQVDDVSLSCANPEIDVDPTSFAEEMYVDTQRTRTLSIGNTGGADLDWMVLEESGDGDVGRGPIQETVAGLATLDQVVDTPEGVTLSPDGLLYDQTDNPSPNGAPSQYFPDFLGFGISADDFTVPDPGWVITRVFVMGSYRPESVITVPDWNVNIYLDQGGKPGWLVYSDEGVIAASETSGDPTLDLSTPAELPAGKYWISVVANMEFLAGGGANQWFWTLRTVQSGEPYHWQQSGLFGSSCVFDWQPGSSVCGVGGGVDPDMLFALYGSVGEVPELCTPADIPWLSTDPISGTVPLSGNTDVDVLFDTTGLSAGTYNATLCIESNDYETGLVRVPVTLEVNVPSITLTKTVGVQSGVCADDDVLSLNFGGQSVDVYYCYEVTNTGTVTQYLHFLDDSELGLLIDDWWNPIGPGESYQAIFSTTLSAGVVNTATWTSYWTEAPPVEATASATVREVTPSIALTKTVGIVPGVCADDDVLEVNFGGGTVDVYYCYEVTNTGTITQYLHFLDDSELGLLIDEWWNPIGPGESYQAIFSTTLSAGVVNTATWTSYWTEGDPVEATATATIREITPTSVTVSSIGELKPVSLTPVWLAALVLIIFTGTALIWRRRKTL